MQNVNKRQTINDGFYKIENTNKMLLVVTIVNKKHAISYYIYEQLHLFCALRKYRGGDSNEIRKYIIKQNFNLWSRSRACECALWLEQQLYANGTLKQETKRIKQD